MASLFGDIISGRNYKRNVLLTDNLNFVLDRDEKLKWQKNMRFVRDWSVACAFDANGFLDHVLFGNESPELLSRLKNNLNRLDPRNAYEMFKLIARHHLLAFFENPENKTYVLDNTNLDRNHFEGKVCSVFAFTREDKEALKILKKTKREDVSIYFDELYCQVLEKGYGIGSDEAGMAEITTFAALLTDFYVGPFLKALEVAMHQ